MGNLLVEIPTLIIYWFKCSQSNCQKEYIGESDRLYGDRLKEHLRTPSPIHHHSHTKGHPVHEEYFTIGSRESQVVTRIIKKQCTFGLMIHALTGMWGNTSCLTYGMRYLRTLHRYGSSNSTQQPPDGPPQYHTTYMGTCTS